MPDPQLTPEPKVKVRLEADPLSGAVCIVDTASVSGLKEGDTVLWTAQDAPNDFKIVLPDDTVFGVDSFTLKKGDSAIKKVRPGLQAGLRQDYVIFCLKSFRKVKTTDGVEPTIIIGG